MYKAAIVGGFIFWYCLDDIQNILSQFWRHEPKLEYRDGVLTSESAVRLLKRMKKNLKFVLTDFTERFIKERKRFDGIDYERVVNEYREGLKIKREEVFVETLESFGISKENFARSLKVLEGDDVRKATMELKSLRVVSKEIRPGMDQLNVILMAKDYIDMMQAGLERGTKYSERFRILDELYQKFGISELELYLAFKMHRNYLAIYELTHLVLRLEERFGYL